MSHLSAETLRERSNRSDIKDLSRSQRRSLRQIKAKRRALRRANRKAG